MKTPIKLNEAAKLNVENLLMNRRKTVDEWTGKKMFRPISL